MSSESYSKNAQINATFKNVSLEEVIQKYSSDYSPQLAKNSKTKSPAPTRLKVKLSELLQRPEYSKAIREKLTHLEEYKNFLEPEIDTSIPSTRDYFSYPQPKTSPFSSKVTEFLQSTLNLENSFKLVPSYSKSRVPSAVLVSDGDTFQLYDIQKT